MMNCNLSIGILSWKSSKTIRNTLSSYRDNGLFQMTNDITILFQEVTEEDKQLADEFGVSFIGIKNNIGIGKGFLSLCENAKSENVLLLENDWELIKDFDFTKNYICRSIDMLNRVNCIRLRHRKKPGFPLYSIDAYRGKELEHYCPNIELTSPHLMDCIHWKENPHIDFPDKIQKEGDFFITSSRWSNWNNNPCLYKRNFYRECVTPFVSNDDLLLEPVISKWWARQNFKIAMGDGLFSHKDLEKYGEHYEQSI